MTGKITQMYAPVVQKKQKSNLHSCTVHTVGCCYSLVTFSLLSALLKLLLYHSNPMKSGVPNKYTTLSSSSSSSAQVVYPPHGRRRIKIKDWKKSSVTFVVEHILGKVVDMVEDQRRGKVYPLFNSAHQKTNQSYWLTCLTFFLIPKKFHALILLSSVDSIH